MQSLSAARDEPDNALVVEDLFGAEIDGSFLRTLPQDCLPHGEKASAERLAEHANFFLAADEAGIGVEVESVACSDTDFIDELWSAYLTHWEGEAADLYGQVFGDDPYQPYGMFVFDEGSVFLDVMSGTCLCLEDYEIEPGSSIAKALSGLKFAADYCRVPWMMPHDLEMFCMFDESVELIREAKKNNTLEALKNEWYEIGESMFIPMEFEFTLALQEAMDDPHHWLETPDSIDQALSWISGAGRDFELIASLFAVALETVDRPSSSGVVVEHPEMYELQPGEITRVVITNGGVSETINLLTRGGLDAGEPLAVPVGNTEHPVELRRKLIWELLIAAIAFKANDAVAAHFDNGDTLTGGE